MNIFGIRNVELNNVSDSNFIKFLRIEIPERNGYGPVRFARVRYALNGDRREEENGLPIDLGKGIFTATLEDEELGEIPREELEKTLQKAAAEIVKIVRKELDPPTILKCILKDYAYLKYSEKHSEPPDVLRCNVIHPKSSRQTADIFEIARRLKTATGIDYNVGTYGGPSMPGDDLDKVWTNFSLRKFKLGEKSGEN